MEKWDAATCIRHMRVFRAPTSCCLLFRAAFQGWLTLGCDTAVWCIGQCSIAWWKSRVVCPFCHPPPSIPFYSMLNAKFSYYLKVFAVAFLWCFASRIWLKSASVSPPLLAPRKLAALMLSDISKQLKLFLPTSSCSLNLFNPVECKLIYREKGARPGLAAAARNVSVGEMINTPATEQGRDMDRLSTTIRLFNVQR